MALPTILIDSATGSDTQASGAGPATALFGTTDASTDGAGTTVTLTAGTDLSGVATDGSHVIFLNDSTAGARNFGKITGSAGSGGATPTVTVANAFGLSLSGKSWAIGGKRASLAGTTSLKLYSNNSAAGDAMPGWTIEMQSGHAESISAAIVMRRAGDTTTGPITLKGTLGAGTLPKITATGNITMLDVEADYHIIQDFELTAGAATVSNGIYPFGGRCTIQRMKFSRTSTNKFTNGVQCGNTNKIKVLDCYFSSGCCATGILMGSSYCTAKNNHIIGCTTAGVTINGNLSSNHVLFNIIESGAIGISFPSTGSNSADVIIGNTINNNSGDGIVFSGAAPTLYAGLVCDNNILSNNGTTAGYGINFSSASSTDAALAAFGVQLRGNQTYLNTSGAYHSNTGTYTNSNCPWASGDTGLNPTFTNSGSGDFSIGTNLKAQAFPLGGTNYIGTYGATYSYVDPGAAQRQEMGARARYVMGGF